MSHRSCSNRIFGVHCQPQTSSRTTLFRDNDLTGHFQQRKSGRPLISYPGLFFPLPPFPDDQACGTLMPQRCQQTLTTIALECPRGHLRQPRSRGEVCFNSCKAHIFYVCTFCVCLLGSILVSIVNMSPCRCLAHSSHPAPHSSIPPFGPGATANELQLYARKANNTNSTNPGAGWLLRGTSAIPQSGG